MSSFFVIRYILYSSTFQRVRIVSSPLYSVTKTLSTLCIRTLLNSAISGAWDSNLLQPYCSRVSIHLFTISAHGALSNKAKLFIQIACDNIISIDRQVDLTRRGRGKHPIRACSQKAGADTAAASGLVRADKIHIAGFCLRVDLAINISE